MKPLELKRAIQKREFAPLYFFYGEETYLIDSMLSALTQAAVDPQSADFNLTTFYGGESEPHDILNTARTLPLLSDLRLVIVKNADQLKSSSWKEFSSYYTHPLPSTCLVFCGEKMALPAGLLTLFKREGKVVRFYHPFEREMAEWITRMVKEFGKTITSEAIALLRLELGNDLQTLHNELQKIATYLGEKKLIGEDEVREVLSHLRGGSVFALLDCIGHHDLEGALAQAERLLDAGEAPLKIHSMIGYRIRILLRAKEMLLKGCSDEEVRSALGVRDFRLTKLLDQVRSFPLSRAESYLHCLFRSDWMLKSSRISKRIILERLIIQLCGSAM